MTDKRRWAGTTYGNAWMHRVLTSILRHSDIRIWYAFAAVFVVPPCLIFRDGYKPIYRFFRRRMGYNPFRSFVKVYANHRIFSQVVIDKFAMYAGRTFTVKIDGYDHFLCLEKGNEGFVQLSSHIGNYEIAGYSLKSEKKPLNALVYAGEKASVMINRMKMFSKTNIRLIPVSADMSHLYEINNAIQRGEIISMPADRMLGSKKSISIDFLGRRASFPKGVFAVATIQQSDVVAVNVMKTSAKEYTIFVRPLAYDKSASRAEQIKQLAESYAAELEKRVREYPAQWFNFYEFWNDGE